MAQYFQSQSKSENLYAILIIVFGMVLGYILYSNDVIPAQVALEPEATRPSDTESMTRLESLKLDFSIFDSIIFKELKVFGEIPVVPGNTGKNDPFSP
ncbi:MAG: hypothetical protein Q7S32_01470 [bacterium]|nr:hypothetical protein [bacterium]